jgi:hypothetical protein
VAPYPIDWRVGDPAVHARWINFARVVLKTADEMGLRVRWGLDWNRNWDRASDPRADPHQTFNDYPHWEIYGA